MTDQGRRHRLVPGFSQTAAAWQPVIDQLPDGGSASALNIPAAESFIETAHQLAREPAGIWAGYSLGGRLALQVALDTPSTVHGLVLISANPGIVDPAARAKRRIADDSLADWIDAHDLDAFLDRWLAQPLFAGLDREQARSHRLDSTRDIAHQLRTLGQGVQEPLWERLGELAMPVILVAGERDEQYAGIARRAAAAIGSTARLAIVPDGGHALLAQHPDAISVILAGL